MKRCITRLLFTIFLAGLTAGMLHAQCGPGEDTTPPELSCTPSVTLTLSGAPPMTYLPATFLDAYSDNCSEPFELTFALSLDGIFIGPALIVDCDLVGGPYTLEVFATDLQGNTNSCQLELFVEENPIVTIACQTAFTVLLEPGATTFLYPEDVLAGTTDPCQSSVFQISLDGSPPADSILLDCSVLDIPNLIYSVEIVDGPGTGNMCWGFLFVAGDPDVCEQVTISGQVFLDTLVNCSFDAGEPGLAGWSVEVTNTQFGLSQTVSTDALGYYTAVGFFDPNLPNMGFELSLSNAPASILPCGDPVVVPVPSGASSVTADLPVTLETDCQALWVDIGAPTFRPCMNSTMTVQYCSFSGFLIAGASVEVTFDDSLSVLGSSLPWTSVVGNTYTFDIGDVDPADCGSFTVSVQVNCGVQVGESLCSEALIFPAENCDAGASSWTGASIRVESACETDQVRFTIHNIGTGDMAGQLDFIIVEDVVMYMSTPFELPQGGQTDIFVPATGATWRLEAEQEPGHPGFYQPVAWMEGCGGLNTPGLVNLFPVNNTDPFESVFCLEATAAIDPNDKRGFPYGLGDERYIEPNQSLDYLIRFQNTGTDTAFNIVIVDTLSGLLQPGSVRPGASSHDYTFETDGNGVIRFVFENVLLPDSTTDLEASQGFVKFRIDQQPDLPEGAEIFNSAAIYFDFMDAVITNETVHRIKEDLLVLSVKEASVEGLPVQVLPNPFRQWATLRLPAGTQVEHGHLKIVDAYGRLVSESSFQGQELLLDGRELRAGIYVFQLFDGQRWLSSGKLIVQ